MGDLMGSFFNQALNSFVDGFRSFINGSFFAAIGDIFELIFNSLPTPLLYLLAIISIGTIFYAVKNISSYLVSIFGKIFGVGL